MKSIIFLALFTFLCTGVALAGTIQYTGTGRDVADILVAYSNNNGASWVNVTVKKGKIFRFPDTATNLKINNISYNPKLNYKVKDNKVYPVK